MNTSDVLNRAADLIEERGWTQGGDGWAGVNGPLCLEGGILAAIDHQDPYARPWYAGLGTCPAYDAVHEYLHLDEMGTAWRWNDAVGRTAGEVVEVLRAAAVIEAARENAAVEVSA